jgi:hypothetical protein
MDKFDELISSLKFDEPSSSPSRQQQTSTANDEHDECEASTLETKLSSFKTNAYMYLVNSKDDDGDRTLDDSLQDNHRTSEFKNQ